MGFHTFDPASADRLEDESRYRYLSREELVAALALGADRDATVADLGSGTGFYTDDVAPFAGEVRAVDVQDEMHELYREKDVPGNVELVTADIGDLPFADGELDAAFSTMTFHEFAGSGHGSGDGDGGGDDGDGDYRNSGNNSGSDGGGDSGSDGGSDSGSDSRGDSGSDGSDGDSDDSGAETEVVRVLRDGGRFVVADWTANGAGEGGPPLGERYDRDEAVELLEGAGFEIVRADERPETFLVVARA